MRREDSPVSPIHGPNVGFTLGQRRRRWLNHGPTLGVSNMASSLKCVALRMHDSVFIHTNTRTNARIMLAHRLIRWANVNLTLGVHLLKNIQAVDASYLSFQVIHLLKRCRVPYILSQLILKPENFNVLCQLLNCRRILCVILANVNFCEDYKLQEYKPLHVYIKNTLKQEALCLYVDSVFCSVSDLKKYLIPSV